VSLSLSVSLCLSLTKRDIAHKRGDRERQDRVLLHFNQRCLWAQVTTAEAPYVKWEGELTYLLHHQQAHHTTADAHLQLAQQVPVSLCTPQGGRGALLIV
jgi:hypothetical protein